MEVCGTRRLNIENLPKMEIIVMKDALAVLETSINRMRMKPINGGGKVPEIHSGGKV